MDLQAPAVPINVDEETGVWTTDALPMLYVPRHFFMNNHSVIEEALGADKYAEILYQAGYKSAYYWCQQEAKEHDIFGVEVFEHYMLRLSQRGWGIFSIEDIDMEKGYAKVRLDHSAFVYHYGKVNRKLEYMFTGWFAGAMDQIVERLGYTISTQAQQLQSEAEEGCDYGLFEVKAIGEGEITRH